jgi:hypothetical protein
MAHAEGVADHSSAQTLTYRSPLFASVGVLWLMLLVAEFWHPCFFLHDDNATSFLGSYLHDYRVLASTGRVAEIDYYQYGGESFLEQGQTGVLYPPVYLAVALAKAIPGDARWTIEWLAALHLTLGLIGFYGWLRQSHAGHGIAALAALAWVLSPFIFLVASSWIFVTYVAAWLPWLFWATDRLFERPRLRLSMVLGGFLGLFFLQGYVQWVVYSAWFLGLYIILRLLWRIDLRRGAIAWHLFVAAIVFLIFALPLLLPMLHAIENSAARAEPLPLAEALYYRAEPSDVLPAQIGLFRSKFMFGMSSAIFFCAAFWLVPAIVHGFARGNVVLRQRLFAILILAALALLWSSHWHVMLTMLPVFERFRWPFKVFIFVDFFLLAAAAWSLSSWKRHNLAVGIMALVVVASALVSFAQHEKNFFSPSTVPANENPLVTGMNPTLGRTIAIDENTPDEKMHLLLTHAYGTYYEMPSMGGYNPLVSRYHLGFSLGLFFPNLWNEPISDQVRAQLEARAVRYWIVGADSTYLPAIKTMDGLEVLASDSDRIVFEDPRALPLVASAPAPNAPVPFRYSGNSLLIPLKGVMSPLVLSLSHDGGFWYRIDDGPWLQDRLRWHYYPDGNTSLTIPFSPSSHVLELSYFDPCFREGLLASLYLVIVLVVIIAIQLRFFRR